jgi:uracil-DNA glycosylase family 4
MIVNTEGPSDARIMLVGEAPGKDENILGRPFVGYAGQTLDNLLGQAGIARYQCLVTNVAREQPPANKISYFFEDKKCTIPKPKLVAWIAKLKEEIELYKPNILIALGATALWALTSEKKISDFRGYILPCSLVPGRKVIATYHPQAINYDWKLYFQTVLDLRKALRHSAFPGIPENKQTLVSNSDVGQFIAYMEELIDHPEWDKLSIDVETVQPGSHIEELGISHDPNFAMSIFLLKGRNPALCENDELRLWQTFARLLKSGKKIVMQNGTYDIGVLWHNNHILVEKLWMDTLLAAHVCWPELPRDLGFLGSVCLDLPPWKSKAIRTSEYNAGDAANTLGIALVLDKEIDKQGIRSTFDFEMSLIPVSLMMQLQGIEVDRVKQKELIDLWTVKRAELKTQLDKVIGREINFNSSKQMCQLLYIELGLPVQYKRRKSIEESRTMTCDTNALRTLSRLVTNNPVFNLIIDYKKADLLLRQFLDIELSPEGKVHTSYNITGATSDDEEDTKKTKRSFGRWSSSGSIILPYGSGNLQNIPPEARKMYRAKPGYKIIQADYIQAEAVVVAYLTGDYKLIKMFKDSFGLSKTERSRYDVHKITYAQMAGIDVDQVSKEQRTAGKTVRHATSYSAGPQVLANRLGIKLSEAKILMDMYHKANPSLRMWYTSIQQELKKNRVLTNLFGRKHRFLDRWGDSLFRSSYSYKPQSTVGDLLNTALLRIYNSILELPFETIILLQLHDAVYVMVKEENVMDTIKFLRKQMLIPLECNNEEFTIDVDFGVGESWGEKEEVEINWRNN